MKRPRTCQITVDPDDGATCGKRAEWWSDDISRDGMTVWMCERCCSRMMADVDTAAAYRTCGDCSATVSHADEECAECVRIRGAA